MTIVVCESIGFVASCRVVPKFGSRRYVFFFLSKCVISIEYLLMMYKYSTLFYVCSNMSSELSECGESASGPQLCSSDSCRVQEFQQGYDAEEVGSGVEGGVQGSTKEWTEEFGHKISQLRGDIICGVKNKEKAEERIAESGAMKQLPVEFLQVEEAEKLNVGKREEANKRGIGTIIYEAHTPIEVQEKTRDEAEIAEVEKLDAEYGVSLGLVIDAHLCINDGEQLKKRTTVVVETDPITKMFSGSAEAKTKEEFKSELTTPTEAKTDATEGVCVVGKLDVEDKTEEPQMKEMKKGQPKEQVATLKSQVILEEACHKVAEAEELKEEVAELETQDKMPMDGACQEVVEAEQPKEGVAGLEAQVMMDKVCREVAEVEQPKEEVSKVEDRVTMGEECHNIVETNQSEEEVAGLKTQVMIEGAHQEVVRERKPGEMVLKPEVQVDIQENSQEMVERPEKVVAEPESEVMMEEIYQEVAEAEKSREEVTEPEVEVAKGAVVSDAKVTVEDQAYQEVVESEIEPEIEKAVPEEDRLKQEVAEADKGIHEMFVGHADAEGDIADQLCEMPEEEEAGLSGEASLELNVADHLKCDNRQDVVPTVAPTDTSRAGQSLSPPLEVLEISTSSESAVVCFEEKVSSETVVEEILHKANNERQSETEQVSGAGEENILVESNQIEQQKKGAVEVVKEELNMAVTQIVNEAPIVSEDGESQSKLIEGQGVTESVFDEIPAVTDLNSKGLALDGEIFSQLEGSVAVGEALEYPAQVPARVVPELSGERAVVPPEVNKVQNSEPHSLHHIKTIQFKDKKLMIVTQNENGPCPLIAIMNVLLLRRQVSLPAQCEIISAAKLMEYIGNAILENVPKNLSGEVELNYEQNMHDAMAVLPKLQTGLDVNVKFTGVRDFEYTPECIVFDLLHIPLYHGWLVDPQTPEIIAAIGLLSLSPIDFRSN